MTPQEETVILEARDILGRYLSQNPVIGSWQALMDYCALTVRGPIERFHVPLSSTARDRIIADVSFCRPAQSIMPRLSARGDHKEGPDARTPAPPDPFDSTNHPSGDPTPSEADLRHDQGDPEGLQVSRPALA